MLLKRAQFLKKILLKRTTNLVNECPIFFSKI